MVVVDLPRIAQGVASLRTSRLAPIYNTVTPSLKVFATLFGKALQAQVGARSPPFFVLFRVCLSCFLHSCDGGGRRG